jgi:hypothetical protein
VQHVPGGVELLTYSDIDTAAQCLEVMQRDWSRHAAAERRFPREYIADRVLGRVLPLAGVSAGTFRGPASGGTGRVRLSARAARAVCGARLGGAPGDLV